ncbi:MAG: DUF4382 domain-containing protein [Symploca sp. SIO2E9]|nr:DUF4382 domain-containing protein [Symploca sp. SIO2E9]
MLLATGMPLGCSQSANQSETQINEERGFLQFRANGEDFVRKGFVSIDGWQISFEHVYVNLAEITAYQSEPPFNAEAGGSIQAQEKVVLNQAKTVDLAEGDEDAESILVAEVANAPAGQYNALSWKMIKAKEGPAIGQTLVMDGTAEKDGRKIEFVVKLDQELEYRCGEFIGDERKGILLRDGTAELEATFHFDHLFGDRNAPADDVINTGALGFESLVALSKDQKLEVDGAELKSRLSATEYKQLEEILFNLGHVGEGHCQANPIA